MPLYEFRCIKCSKINELMMGIAQPHPEHCLFCSSGPMEKLVSRANFTLKGQGGYKSDFKKKTFRSTIDDVPTIEEAEKAISK